MMIINNKIVKMDSPPKNDFQVLAGAATVRSLQVLEQALEIDALVVAQAHVVSVGLARSGEVQPANPGHAHDGEQEAQVRNHLGAATGVAVQVHHHGVLLLFLLIMLLLFFFSFFFFLVVVVDSGPNGGLHFQKGMGGLLRKVILGIAEIVVAIISAVAAAAAIVVVAHDIARQQFDIVPPEALFEEREFGRTLRYT